MTETREIYFQPLGYLVDAAPEGAGASQWLVRLSGEAGQIVFGPHEGKAGFYACRQYINKAAGFIFQRPAMEDDE